MNTQTYKGPAGLFLSPDDLLLIWQSLNLIPTVENKEVRERIKQFLEERDANTADTGQLP